MTGSVAGIRRRCTVARRRETPHLPPDRDFYGQTLISGKCWVNNHAHVVKPKAGICEIDFLHKYLEIVDLRPYISGTTRQKLTQAKMKEIVCIKPSLCDQRNFVAIAEKAEAAKTALKKSIADIDQVMKGLINNG